MAEPRYNPDNPGDAAAKLGPEKARQGQEVKGMIWVLIVGIALVVLAYTVMLALSAQPANPDNRPAVTQGEVVPPTTLPLPPETPRRPDSL